MSQQRLSKAERLNYILERMRIRQDATPQTLAQELAVSERTVYRDLNALEQEMTLKKHFSRTEDRYILDDDVPIILPLRPREALALFVAASNPALAEDNFFSTNLHNALDKIGNALTPGAQKEVQALGGRIAVSTANLSAESVERPIMAKVRDAIRTNRKMRLLYWSASSNVERTLIVSPYHLRFLRHSWYLLAHSQEHEEVRTFKVSRIRSADLLTDRFRLPRQFSTANYLARAWEMCGGQEEEILVQARFAPQVAALVADSRGRQFVAMEPQQDGSLVCTALVNSLKEISWWLLSYGSSVEVLSPPELRDFFARTAQEMATLYRAFPPADVYPELYTDSILVAEDAANPYKPEPDSTSERNP